MSNQALGDLITVDPFNMVSLTAKPSLGTGMYLDADPNNSSFLLQTNSGDAMYIDKFHNIGINTRSPTAQLDVNGTNTHIQLTYNNTINKATLDVTSDGKLALTSTGYEINTDVNSSFDVKSHDGSTKGLKLGGVLLTATAAQLNSLAGGSSGGSTFTVADTITITNANGVDKGLILGSTLVTSSAAELNYLDGSTPGTVSASKAIVVDANKDFSGGRNTSVTGTFTTTATTDSSSVSTGTIVTAGGVGMAKNLYVGGNEYITSYTSSSSASTGALVVNGGVGIGGSLYVGATSVIANATDSLSTSTGSLTTTGGIGIAKRLNVGSSINSIGNVITNSNIIAGNNVQVTSTVSSNNVLSSAVNLISDAGSPFDVSMITTFTNTGNSSPLIGMIYASAAINGVVSWNGGGSNFSYTQTGSTTSNINISSSLSTTLSGLGYTSITNGIGITVTPDGNIWGAFRGSISSNYYGLLLKGTLGSGFTSLAFATPGNVSSNISFDYVVNLSNQNLICGRTSIGTIYYTTNGGSSFNTSATTGFTSIKPMFSKYIRNISSNPSGSCLSYSSDGNTWTNCTVPTNNRTMKYLHYNSTLNMGFAFDSTHNYVWTTTDGITWSAATLPTLTSVTFNAGVSAATTGLFVIYPLSTSANLTGVYTLDGTTWTSFAVGDKTNLPFYGYSIDTPSFETAIVPSTNKALWPTVSSSFNIISTPPLTFINKIFKSSASSGYVIDQTDVGFKWKTGATQTTTGTDVMTLNGSLTVAVKESITDTTSSTTSSTGSLVVSGGVGIAENLNIGGTTDASSSSTGAVVLSGGMGIAKSLYIGGTTGSTSTSTGAVVVAGGAGITENLYVGGNLDVTSHNGSTAGLKLGGTLLTATATQLNSLASGTGPADFTIADTLTITNANGIDKGLILGSTLVTASATELNYLDGVTAGTATASNALVVDASKDISAIRNLSTTGVISTSLITDSSSTTTGAVTVAGGVGIAKKLYVGGVTSITDATDSTSTSTGALIVSGGVGVAKNVNIGGTATITDVSQSTTTTTGALVVSGGVGVAKNITVGGVVSITDTTDSSSTSTGSFVTAGGMGVASKLYVGDIATFSSTQESSSTSTGAVITAGGVGIAKKLYVGGATSITDATDSTSTSTGALIVSGGVGVAKNVNIGGVASVTDATDASSTTSGSVIISGGVGIAKKVYIGDITTISSTQSSTSASSGALVVSGGAGIAENLYVGGTTDASSASTGAFVVAGGVGVAKKLYIGDSTDATMTTDGSLVVAGGVGVAKKLFVGSTTGSTSTSSGAMVVSGGAGIAENLYVGGNAVITGNLTVSGTTTTVNSTVVDIADNTLVLNAGPSGSGKDAGILMSRYQVDNDTGTGDVVADTAKYTTTIDSSADLTHITLASGANTNDNYYNDWWIKITSGNAANNVRKITAYNGTTLTATLSSALSSAPATSDTISLYNKPFPTFIWQEATDRFVATFAPIDSTTTINTQDYADVGVSKLFINSTTGSTSTTSGALTIAGGAGVAENLYVGGSLNVNGTSMTNTTLGYLSGITPGTVTASKALVVDANKDLSSIHDLDTVTLDVTGHDGATVGLSLSGTLVTATASELNYVDVTAGSGTASKALVLDSSKNISSINKIGTTSLRVGTPASDALPIEVGYVSYQFTGAFAFSNSNNAHGLIEAGTAASANYSMRTDGRILCTGELEITSDRRLKENIIELTPELSKKFIMTTTPVKFNWRTGDKIVDYGYIAQDIYKKGFTDLVTITPSQGMIECIDEDGFVSPKDAKFVFSPGKIIPMLALNQREVFNELQEKDAKIANLEDRIAQLEELVKKLIN